MNEHHHRAKNELSESVKDIVKALEDQGMLNVAKSVRNTARCRDDQMQLVIDDIHSLQMSIDIHLDNEKRIIEELQGAFPDGDTRGHREAHNAWIAREARRAKYQQAIIEKTLAGFLWLMLVAAGTAIWQFIKTSINR